MSELRWWKVCATVAVLLTVVACGQSPDDTEPVSAGVEVGGTVVAELAPTS